VLRCHDVVPNAKIVTVAGSQIQGIEVTLTLALSHAGSPVLQLYFALRLARRDSLANIVESERCSNHRAIAKRAIDLLGRPTGLGLKRDCKSLFLARVGVMLCRGAWDALQGCSVCTARRCIVCMQPDASRSSRGSLACSNVTVRDGDDIIFDLNEWR
jgi:hypothetical protein